MFEEAKQQLLTQPESIVHILEAFGCDKIKIRNHEIRCARDFGGNPTAVVIKLANNENLFVKDYELNESYDLINYIVKVKGAPFKTVIDVIKDELGLDSIYSRKHSSSLFGGIYDRVSKSRGELNLKTYPEDILRPYGNTPNIRFLRDGISLRTQRKWNVGFDPLSQRITFPIRSPGSEIIGIKGRCNYTPDEYEAKYLYLQNCAMSQTLFGYSENYNNLYENHILLFESEKSVMVCDSMGYHNAVALGSNNLSETQAKLLLSVNPKSVIFMLDNSLPLENTKRNADVLKSFCKMRDLDIYYFDWTECSLLEEKAAPVDGGKQVFEEILDNHIKSVEELYKEK